MPFLSYPVRVDQHQALKPPHARGRGDRRLHSSQQQRNQRAHREFVSGCHLHRRQDPGVRTVFVAQSPAGQTDFQQLLSRTPTPWQTCTTTNCWVIRCLVSGAGIEHNPSECVFALLSSPGERPSVFSVFVEACSVLAVGAFYALRSVVAF